MSRIKTPLEGSLVNPLGEHEWELDNWSVLKTPVYDIDTTSFRVEYQKHDGNFTQKSWIEGSGYFSEFRFKLIKRRWYLVYAQEVNL